MTRFISSRLALLSALAVLAPVQGGSTLEGTHQRDRVPPIAPEFQSPRGFVPRPERKIKKKFVDPHDYNKKRHMGKPRGR